MNILTIALMARATAMVLDQIYLDSLPAELICNNICSFLRLPSCVMLGSTSKYFHDSILPKSLLEQRYKRPDGTWTPKVTSEFRELLRKEKLSSRDELIMRQLRSFLETFWYQSQDPHEQGILQVHLKSLLGYTKDKIEIYLVQNRPEANAHILSFPELWNRVTISTSEAKSIYPDQLVCLLSKGYLSLSLTSLGSLCFYEDQDLVKALLSTLPDPETALAIVNERSIASLRSWNANERTALIEGVLALRYYSEDVKSDLGNMLTVFPHKKSLFHHFSNLIMENQITLDIVHQFQPANNTIALLEMMMTGYSSDLYHFVRDRKLVKKVQKGFSTKSLRAPVSKMFEHAMIMGKGDSELDWLLAELPNKFFFVFWMLVAKRKALLASFLQDHPDFVIEVDVPLIMKTKTKIDADLEMLLMVLPRIDNQSEFIWLWAQVDKCPESKIPKLVERSLSIGVSFSTFRWLLCHEVLSIPGVSKLITKFLVKSQGMRILLNSAGPANFLNSPYILETIIANMSEMTREECLAVLRKQVNVLEDIIIASIPYCLLVRLLNSKEGFDELVSRYDEKTVICSLARMVPDRFEFHKASIKDVSAVKEVKACVEENRYHFINITASQKRVIIQCCEA